MPRKLKRINKFSGRPRKKIDWDEVDKMLSMGALGTEVAAYFDMHAVTFYDRVQAEKGVDFTQYCSQKHSRRDLSLRLKQFQLAMDGNTTMLVFLGKALLNQTEKQEVDFRINISMLDYRNAPVDHSEDWAPDDNKLIE